MSSSTQSPDTCKKSERETPKPLHPHDNKDEEIEVDFAGIKCKIRNPSPLTFKILLVLVIFFIVIVLLFKNIFLFGWLATWRRK